MVLSCIKSTMCTHWSHLNGLKSINFELPHFQRTPFHHPMKCQNRANWVGWRLYLALFLHHSPTHCHSYAFGLAHQLCFCLLFASFHPKWNRAWNRLWTCSRGAIHIIRKWNNYLTLHNMNTGYRRVFVCGRAIRSKWVISIKSLILYGQTFDIRGLKWFRPSFLYVWLALPRPHCGCAHRLFYRNKLFVLSLICVRLVLLPPPPPNVHRMFLFWTKRWLDNNNIDNNIIIPAIE